jgi:hypothetical protein
LAEITVIRPGGVANPAGQCADYVLHLNKRGRIMGEPIHPELLVVGAYPDELTANLAKTALEAAGIESMIRNDNTSQYPTGLGFELVVTSDDATEARKILSK